MIRGDLGKLRAFEQTLRELPRTLAIRVAEASAGEITRLARGTYGRSENAYGDAWSPGAKGQTVTLHKSGRLGSFAYVAIGVRLRAQLGPRYAKYQIGRRPILPRNGARLPVAYVGAIGARSSEIIRAALRGAG